MRMIGRKGQGFMIPPGACQGMRRLPAAAPEMLCDLEGGAAATFTPATIKRGLLASEVIRRRSTYFVADFACRFKPVLLVFRGWGRGPWLR